MDSAETPLVSIVTPAYRETKNLPVLFDRLKSVFEKLNVAWEWIVIDDHSPDDTFQTICKLANENNYVRGIRFARNFGSHVAISCGLQQARGRCAVVMAADLQDPPETLPDLLQKWEGGGQVVWAVREKREGEKNTSLGFSRLYYWLMRNVVGMRNMPAEGADFFLLDRTVIDAFCQFTESNVSILALITWMGYRQETIYYTKQARLYGKSGWNLEKKLKLTIDSITSFTYLPIRLIAYAGLIVGVAGFIYAGVVIWNTLTHNPPQGWASLMVVVLVLGGLQMMMMGVLGEYLWRTLDQSRRRPPYLIEAKIGVRVNPSPPKRDLE